MEDKNIVNVGKKGLINYILAVQLQFKKGNEEVIIKARGKAISRLVDVIEVCRQKFIENLDYRDVKIFTEVMEGYDGPKNVSAMEVTLFIK